MAMMGLEKLEKLAVLRFPLQYWDSKRPHAMLLEIGQEGKLRGNGAVPWPQVPTCMHLAMYRPRHSMQGGSPNAFLFLASFFFVAHR